MKWRFVGCPRKAISMQRKTDVAAIVMFGIQCMHGDQSTIQSQFCVCKKILTHNDRHEFRNRLQKSLALLERCYIDQHRFDDSIVFFNP